MSQKLVTLTHSAHKHLEQYAGYALAKHETEALISNLEELRSWEALNESKNLHSLIKRAYIIYYGLEKKLYDLFDKSAAYRDNPNKSNFNKVCELTTDIIDEVNLVKEINRKLDEKGDYVLSLLQATEEKKLRIHINIWCPSDLNEPAKTLIKDMELILEELLNLNSKPGNFKKL